MMKAPIILTAEHWLALSPDARQKMKTYVMPKRIPTSKVLLEDVTGAEDDEELEEPQVLLGSVANILEPGLENCIRIENLPVECLVLEELTIIGDPIVQYLESILEVFKISLPVGLRKKEVRMSLQLWVTNCIMFS
ncbi:hypothetical protein ARMGADRAFT_1034654 [Armillaria gallica]|uniref:Uncharacterized protein n=1 Tax=Armillaria gallica TaxID=47427 RepID=A0A2H3D0Y4_ARMGA|nr:hypothetical protein ARMGADRAFT_1034654 [Armillaria gallica]